MSFVNPAATSERSLSDIFATAKARKRIRRPRKAVCYFTATFVCVEPVLPSLEVALMSKLQVVA